jgi:hypothetical protein
MLELRSSTLVRPSLVFSDWHLICLLKGIGWHEARVPTIATMVPRGAFVWVTSRLKGSVGIPLVTTNRINTPEVSRHCDSNECWPSFALRSQTRSFVKVMQTW